MDNSNRCPECGGIANHCVTDIAGREIFVCTNPLTTLRREGEEVIAGGMIVTCDTYIGNDGKKLDGTFAHIIQITS